MSRMRLLAVALLVASSTAGAAPSVKERLSLYETESRALAANLPASPNQMSTQSGQRRLVDAQVAFTVGDYEGSSLALFDLVGKTQGADKELATYYLAESLYNQGDRGAARVYYGELAKTPGNKYYEQSLLRIVEIAIFEHDQQAGDEAIGKLGSGSAAVTYVRGKWAFAQGKYDEAIGLFNSVARGSEYDGQATYYAGTTYIAKKDLAKASEVFTELLGRKPKTNTDRRVMELAALALARIYYEREQPAKAIDNYLLIDRHSDLFPSALYEVSWVYVKNKQYDKALVALELLGRLDPESTQTPTVKILDGNLRIRKAQMLRQAQIAGTVNAEEHSDPPTEYGKAEKLFNETHDQYKPAYDALNRMAAGTLGASSFIDQLAGRNTRMFTGATPIPEAAAQWLREEPEIQRVVSVEHDLASVAANIKESEAIIARLEGVLATGDRLTLYPSLSSRRSRIAAIQHDLIGIRNDLAEQAIRGGASSPETGNRRSLAQQYQALGDPERAWGDRTGATQMGFDKIGETARDVESAIMSTQATAVALRTFAMTNDKPELEKSMEEVTKEAQAVEDELESVNRELVLGKDLAGIGDEDLKRGRDLRRRLKASQDAEMAGLRGLSAEAQQAARLAAALEQLDDQIDGLVGRGLGEIKTILVEERKNLSEYKQLLAEYEREAKDVGGEVLKYTFKSVKDKLYDIVIRSDVGNVDVTWSQKEDSDDDYKRLNLARARDIKQLRDEFKFVLDENAPPPAPKKESFEAPPASPEGQGTQRVSPTGNQKTGTDQPTVKPDESKKPAPTPTPKKAPAPKKAAPKKTGGTP